MPGDPRYADAGFDAVLAAARRDAEAIARGGAAAVIVENFGSAPFPKGHPDQPTPPHQVALIALAVSECRRITGLTVGVNVLRNDARAAVGIAAACGAAFVRVNVHVGAYVTDQGLIEGRAFETLRYRRELGAEVAILADVRVKHAAPLAPVRCAPRSRTACCGAARTRWWSPAPGRASRSIARSSRRWRARRGTRRW
ncbi:MAG: hypothetical protein M5U28_01790 [Sandaracinaceae bacterium]|nr:hypothetical protein [Sandaracinaceae bacterium]